MKKPAWRNFVLTSTLSIAPVLVLSSSANAFQFSFESGQGTTWDHTASGGITSSNGWQPGQTIGTATNAGVTLTVTSTFFGTAQPSNNNLQFQSGNTQGFVFSNNNQSDDNNSSSLTSYQRIDFEFDKLVDFTSFTVADVDTDDETQPVDFLFVDAIGAEGFLSTTGNTIGTGIDPNFDVSNSELIVEDIGGIDYVNRDISTYGRKNVASSSALGQAGISFNQGVRVASLYYFNDMDNAVSGNHSINLAGATIQGQEVPFEFSPTLGLLLAGGGLLGIRQMKKRAKVNLDK